MASELLDPADRRCVDAAQGWLMLGNAGEAHAELQGLSPDGREHPDTLRVYYELSAATGSWTEAHDVATRLTVRVPEDPGVWVWRAYAARRMEGGGLERAYRELHGARERFPQEPILPFNLACYCAQMGKLDEARDWLARAIELGGEPIRKLAGTDPDLEPLRKGQNP